MNVCGVRSNRYGGKTFWFTEYMNSENNLIFRYDNAEHHRKLNLTTFSHHKHDGSEGNIVKSDAPFLTEILKEIEKILE